MRSIAVINQKGGAGKTTTAVNVASAIARTGKRVLLIDLDPQSHASLHVGVQLTDGQPSLYDVLVHRTPVEDAAHTIEERLELLPANIDLVGAELELREAERREYRLADALDNHRDLFDVCIIDCPPSLGLLTINALVAVREVIIPLQPHFLALQGLGRLLETVMLVRHNLNPELRVTGIVLCMYETGTRLAQEVSDDIEGFVRAAQPEDAWYGARVFDTRIRRNIKLAESPSFGQTIHDYAPASHGAADYEALTRELLAIARSAAPGAAPEPVSKTADEIPADPSQPVAPPVAEPDAAAGAPGREHVPVSPPSDESEHRES